MHVCWICRRSLRKCVQTPKHPHEKDNHEQRCEMLEHHMETLQQEKHLCKITGGTLLDEEERSIQDERSFGESSVEEEEEEEEPKSNGNNNTTEKKFGLDINMIGASGETLGKIGVRPKKCPLQEMSPWKEQI